MPILNAPTYPCLILDTTSKRTWVGVKRSKDHLQYGAEMAEAGRALFGLVEQQLDTAQTALNALRSLIICGGPGSMLGIRTAAMAARAWSGIGVSAVEETWSYSSLALGKILLSRNKQDRTGAALILTDAKRNSWNAMPYPGKPDDQQTVISNDELSSSGMRCVTFDSFARWTEPSVELETVEYRPELAFLDESFLPIARRANILDIPSKQPNEYKKWIPTIHGSKPE